MSEPTMWQTIILSFFAGLMGGNAIPHFVKGITKETYPNMLGNSPVPNLEADWTALVITSLLINRARVVRYHEWGFVFITLGVLLIGLLHAWIGAFGRNA